jgi:hypothetical protein
MAADSDGCYNLTTVVTCEGNLSDPDFAERFEAVVGKLNGILGDVVKVHKLEPWNSVRVTLSIPREAALRLRKLASEGSAQLRALGILSVQVEGDQVISLRIANSVNAEPQEIRLQTTQGNDVKFRMIADCKQSGLFQMEAELVDRKSKGRCRAFWGRRRPKLVRKCSSNRRTWCVLRTVWCLKCR